MKTKKVISLITLFCFFSISLSAQIENYARESKQSAAIKFGEPLAVYQDSSQLVNEFLKNGPLLIINNKIYKIPCECYSCRDLGGNTENRNLGGSTESRNLGGNSENRNLGGQTEKRNLGGNSESRNFGGNSENRNLGGSTEKRNLAGNSEARNLGGATEKRNLGGETENRNLGGSSENRNLGGNTMSFKCTKISNSEFLISGINDNSEIKYYDGIKLQTVTSLKIKI